MTQNASRAKAKTNATTKTTTTTTADESSKDKSSHPSLIIVAPSGGASSSAVVAAIMDDNAAAAAAAAVDVDVGVDSAAAVVASSSVVQKEQEDVFPAAAAAVAGSTLSPTHAAASAAGADHGATDATTALLYLEDTFQAVLAWIQQQQQQQQQSHAAAAAASSSSFSSFSLSNADKLRLYGLYKHILSFKSSGSDNNNHEDKEDAAAAAAAAAAEHDDDDCGGSSGGGGSSGTNGSSSCFWSGGGGGGGIFSSTTSIHQRLQNVAASQAKQQARNACRHLTQHQAMQAYIDLFYHKVWLSLESSSSSRFNRHHPINDNDNNDDDNHHPDERSSSSSSSSNQTVRWLQLQRQMQTVLRHLPNSDDDVHSDDDDDDDVEPIDEAVFLNRQKQPQEENHHTTTSAVAATTTTATTTTTASTTGRRRPAAATAVAAVVATKSSPVQRKGNNRNHNKLPMSTTTPPDYHHHAYGGASGGSSSSSSSIRRDDDDGDDDGRGVVGVISSSDMMLFGSSSIWHFVSSIYNRTLRRRRRRRRRFGLWPRGQVDISYSLLFYALCMTLFHAGCFFLGTTNMSSSRDRYESEIVSLWKDALLQNQQNQNGDDDHGKKKTKRNVPTAKEDQEEATSKNDKQQQQQRHNQIEEEQRDRDDEDEPNILVGLAVRSLLDLYLTCQQYPPGSQIIVSPPLNVPGMVQVMRRHNIDLVPIDLPAAAVPLPSAAAVARSSSSSSSSSSTSPTVDHDTDNADVIAVDVPAVERAITKRTVAILVVHAFGIVTTTDRDMEQLRALANRHELHLLEDGAECYTGLLLFNNNNTMRHSTSLRPFLGSRHADISFFSFGLLKTSTALGGGIAVVRSHRHHYGEQQQQPGCRRGGRSSSGVGTIDTTNLAANMQRLQQSVLYQNQGNLQYLQTVVKAFILKWIADCPIVHGIIHSLLSNSIMTLLYGPDCFDRVATWLLQGFKNASSSLSSSHSQVMAQVRQRPCPALLAVLCRALRQNSSVQVANRIQTCRRFTHALSCLQDSHNRTNNEKEKGSCMAVTVPTARQGCQHLYWLYPIRTSTPHELRRRALAAGFDVVTAANNGHGSQNNSINSRISSQLQCVAANPEADCPRTMALMKQVVYLPIASRSDLSISELKRLQRVVLPPPPDSSTTATTGRRCRQSSGGNSTNAPVEMLLFLSPVAISILCVVPLSFVLHTVVVGVYAFFCTIVVLVVAVYIIRWAAACLYVESATSFVQHCKLVQDMSLKILINNNKAGVMAAGVAVEDGLETTASQEEMKHIVSHLCSVQMKAPAREKEASSSIFDTMTVLAIPPTQDAATTIARKVILTGSTGFVGSMLLRDLLRHRKSLSISRILVLCRSKRGESATARIASMLSGSMFSFLSADEKESLVEVLEGDMSMVNVGLSDSLVERLVHDGRISHVFHCAAAVSFTQSLEDAARDNISSALRMQALTTCLVSAVFVHVSTAFVHGGRTGTGSDPLPEQLFPLGPYDATEIYESMRGTQFYASKAMRDLGFPNTYTLSKSVCEHLLSRSTTTKTLIIRPSIVGPALEHPWEGWAGCKPSTVVAAACLVRRVAIP
jgi:dTDP-4-amino-4,6-dideoxygalactose transaminase/nucleoside-diphosphate-sugar epimerase